MLKFLRKLTAIPAVKYSIIAITSFLWLVGFADQLPDVEQTVKYVGISLLMLAQSPQWPDQSGRPRLHAQVSVQYFRSRPDLIVPSLRAQCGRY
jgi:hypothetical protein